MDQHSEYPKPIGERVAVVETRIEDIGSKLDEIERKLDELLQLKAKGMGAFGLVSLLVGSGLIGLVYTIVQFFNHPHL